MSKSISFDGAVIACQLTHDRVIQFGTPEMKAASYLLVTIANVQHAERELVEAQEDARLALEKPARKKRRRPVR